MSKDLLDLAVLERKKYNELNEVMDLTRQLGEALDRGDKVSVQILVAMRQDPILRLEEINRTAKERRKGLPQEEAERVGALLNGSEPRGQEEKTFLEQSKQFRSLLERVVELDRRVNLRMTGEDSFYNKK